MERIERVPRAARLEAANPREQGPHRPAVEVNGQRQQEHEDLHRTTLESRAAMLPKARPSSSRFASFAEVLAISTRSKPRGSSPCRRRKSSRRRRRIRARTTALPTLLETVSPSLVTPRSLGSAIASRGSATTLYPRSCTLRNSWRRLRRKALGNRSPPAGVPAGEATTSSRRRPPTACGPCPGAASARPCRPWSNCAYGTHVPGSASTWMAGKCAWTRLELPWFDATVSRRKGRAHNAISPPSQRRPRAGRSHILPRPPAHQPRICPKKTESKALSPDVSTTGGRLNGKHHNPDRHFRLTGSGKRGRSLFTSATWPSRLIGPRPVC